ncbi:MAG: cytochrome c biogenesis protein CcdA [bacterium]|nr:cytochrome c biogenesis protein CcdA [bacterium]
MPEQTQTPGARIILAASAVVLLAVTVIGLAWFFTTTLDVNDAASGLEQSGATIGLGWFIFSFAAGLTMIVLPCTLPLAFVIVPLTMSKGPRKGLGIALSFGLGVAITLSLYGIAAATIGKVAIGTLGAPLEVVKNWLYFGAGSFAYLFALGGLGLISFRMPSYTGSAPAFIQKQQDYLKALLLGLFLGNVGVGCPHPATPFILGRIAVSESITSGWLLFFVHAVGRVIPLLLLAVLALLGVNGLSWLVTRKDKIERATGWGMVFVAGFILILGLFSHDWWVNSGQHTLLEEITQEQYFLGKIIRNFNFAGVPHPHGIETGTGLFGLPLWLGNWALAALWIVPLWWYYQRKKKTMATLSEEDKKCEERILPWRLWLNVSLSVLIALVVIRVLPDRFLNQFGFIDAPMENVLVHEDKHGEGGEHSAAVYREAKDVQMGLSSDWSDLTSIFGPITTGSTTPLIFLTSEKPAGAVISSPDLEKEHTKYMHVIGVRDDLNEFFHVHPDEDYPGEWLASHIFAKPGRYKIWSEIRKDGTNYVFGQEPIEVTGEGDVGQGIEPIFVNTTIAGDYLVEFLHDPLIVQKQEAHIGFTIRDAKGREVPLEPYIAASMHLNIIKSDWKEEIHVHPEENGHMTQNSGLPTFISVALANAQDAHDDDSFDDDHEDIPLRESSGAAEQAQVHFTVAFPEPGLYKAFAQFRPSGTTLSPEEAVVASFWIKVEEKAPSANPRVVLALASLVLIALLSWGIKKYLEPTSAP